MLKKILNPKGIIFTILVVVVLFLIPKISNLLLVLFASYVIAAALNPMVNRLEAKIKNRAIATFSVVMTSLIALLALFIPIVFTCYKEVELFVMTFPHKLNTLYGLLTHTKLYGKALAHYFPLQNLVDSTSSIAQNLFSQSINLTMALGQVVFVVLALMLFIYYIILDKEYLKNKFIEFFPPKLKDKASEILYNITSRVGKYVRTQILSMVIVGIMVTIELALMGVDYPILLGLITGICEIVPLFGPATALTIIVLVAFQLGWVKILFIVALFITIQQTSNYVIRPFLFGKFMQLHPINIMVAIFIAKEFLGVWGVILSPAIAATICVLIDELYLSPMNSTDLELGVDGE